MKRLIIIASCIFLSQISTAQVMMLFSSDSLTNITSPLDVDSLFYWFAADVGVTDSLGGAIANNEGVGTWNDLSGNGYHVTQGTNGARPVYKATGGSGSKPCIQFDGTNDFLASAAHWWGSDDLTVFVVMKWASATSGAGAICTKRGNTTDLSYNIYGAGAGTSYRRSFWSSADGSGGAVRIDQWQPKETTYRSLVYVVNTSSDISNLYVDGLDETRAVNATQTGIYDSSSTSFYIGGSIAGEFLGGSISEIIVFSRALTATERQAIETYLNRKYDLY